MINSSAQEFKTVRDGIEYAEVTRDIAGLNVNMNLLRLDLTKVRLDVHHAMDAAIGTEKTSSIATRHGAFAAINAGFFRLDTSIWAGDAAGVLQIDHRLLSESSNNRTAIFVRNWGSYTEVSFAPIDIGSSFQLGKHDYHFTGVNRQRSDEDVIEYTPAFGRTTLTGAKGLEFVVSNGKIITINDGQGSTEIPPKGYVISASGKYAEELRALGKIGSKVNSFVYVAHRMGKAFPNVESMRTDSAFSGAEDITNGVPQLIKNSKIDITWEQEKSSKSFVETRHPRTAVANLKDGKFLMITVDGRSEASGGIGLQDLAEYLLSLGATDAMNLDGGGSTTMFVDGKVVNHPSDKEGERKVSDAILVTPRKKH
ncbi:MAG: phosphodiester glycosidase family protein [Pyrinomonadaceae bacterium]